MNAIPDEKVLQQHIIEATAWVREQLRRADLGSNFTLTIQIEGPIQTGVSKLIYTLDHSKNYQASVQGNSLAEVTFELLRRSGWTKKNLGLVLDWNGADAPSLYETK